MAKLNLAIVLMMQGEFAEARRLLDAAVAGFTAQLGAGHPHTQQARQCAAS